MVSKGHAKEAVLYEYSLPEVRLLYEKIVQEELSHRADFIEDIILGIGGALGGVKAFREIQPILTTLRGG